MVGAEAAVLLGTPAELADGHAQNPVGQTETGHIVHELCDGIGEAFEQLGMGAEQRVGLLRDMGIEASHRDYIDFRIEASGDQCSGRRDLLCQRVVGVVAAKPRLSCRVGIPDSLGIAVRTAGDIGDELVLHLVRSAGAFVVEGIGLGDEALLQVGACHLDSHTPLRAEQR